MGGTGNRSYGIIAMGLAFLMVLGDFVLPSPVQAAQTHGTTDQTITEDMLNLTPPKDYEIPQNMQAEAKEGLYNAYFLEDELQTVYIDIDENNLNYMFQNALDKPSVMTNSVTIGDQTIGYAGIKTKGSYTLTHTYTDNVGSDRFSFTLNFGKYIKKKEYGQKQNFYGCSKISFNNFFFDKSMMREYFSLKLMSEMGVPTPQYGLAKVYINDEYYGVYFMVEAMDSSILEQYFNVSKDEISSYLVKPEETTLLYKELEADDSPLWEKDEETYEDVQDMLPTVMEWVQKLNQLSEGLDFSGNEIDVNGTEYPKLLSEIMDVDEVVKYFAVHSFLVQLDNMFVEQHNYGLYVDAEGACMVIPWDYDLSFGCYFPSDAESTANYNINALMKDGNNRSMAMADYDWEYENYPLFHVISQNDALVEKYHAYMEDCAKIAAFGGTVSTGESYEPAWFASFIDAMQEELIEAASEPLADNVYYLNRTRQPSDLIAALPNLKKIIAMRSAGVLAQVRGWDTIVSGYGCNLSTLGNALEGWSATEGKITIIDADTGIFASAEYGEGSRNSAPLLTVQRLESEEDNYKEILAEVEKDGAKESDALLVYSMKDNGKPMGDYQIYIPLEGAYNSADEIFMYTYRNGELTPLEVERVDNICCSATQELGTIVLVAKGQAEAVAAQNGDASGTDMAEKNGQVRWFVYLLPALVVIAAGAGVFVAIRRKRK